MDISIAESNPDMGSQVLMIWLWDFSDGVYHAMDITIAESNPDMGSQVLVIWLWKTRTKKTHTIFKSVSPFMGRMWTLMKK